MVWVMHLNSTSQYKTNNIIFFGHQSSKLCTPCYEMITKLEHMHMFQRSPVPMKTYLKQALHTSQKVSSKLKRGRHPKSDCQQAYNVIFMSKSTSQCKRTRCKQFLHADFYAESVHFQKVCRSTYTSNYATCIILQHHQDRFLRTHFTSAMKDCSGKTLSKVICKRLRRYCDKPMGRLQESM